MNKTQILFLPKQNCDHLLGKFLDESHYDILVDFNTDAYAKVQTVDGETPAGESICLFKFRKGVFSAEEQRGAYEGLIGAAKESQNRGLAAGPKGEKLLQRDWVSDWQMVAIDLLANPTARLDGVDSIVEHIAFRDNWQEASPRGLVWLRTKIEAEFTDYDGFFDRWLAKVVPKDVASRQEEALRLSRTCISQTTYANPVNSGVAGFFDRYPRIPYGRACAYNQKDPDTFAKSFSYLEKLDLGFKTLLPVRYGKQRAAADKIDSRFLIDGTVFTTLTVNKTFRTAAHLDAGDYGDGFSNLGVISTGKDYAGGYLVLPEYRVAINIRPGDLLLIANHEAIHGNTPILPVEGASEDDVMRMSIVAYFREAMLDLGSWDYEQARFQFIESRRKNEQHPMWRPGWNGVSAAWEKSEEWYEWLRALDESMLATYHPEANEKAISLSEFF